MCEVVQIVGELQKRRIKEKLHVNGDPAIYFFGSSNSKERNEGTVMVGELKLLGLARL
jgi:hypothetical protein